MLLQPGICPGSNWGSLQLQRSPDSLAGFRGGEGQLRGRRGEGKGRKEKGKRR